ncbi:hypothetical protein Q8F55_001249 [Vanrija albida]|uniref:Impact N-terminal domain-containing protein n=1 Tax=Vanrija albida TaxID=181172 RepID=A0ABR3QFI5_9TREE
MSKRGLEGDTAGAPSIAPKRARAYTPPRAPTLDGWLKPDAPPPLLAASPHLHDQDSTFISFTLSFEPPSHVRTVAALTKEAKRIVRELDVVRLVGEELLARNEGAFQAGEGRAPGRSKGKERASEPTCRMWAARVVGLNEGKNGTGGEGDYQLLEAFDDDGEKFGGERLLRVLQEQSAVDVITICVRWFGGSMLGPARFQHISITAKDSLKELQTLVTRRDLRADLDRLDDEIAAMRATLAPPGSPLRSVEDGAVSSQKSTDGGSKGKYNDIDDVLRLQRLRQAREKTKANLESRVGWVGLDQSRAEDAAAAAARAPAASRQ